jgi:hypothetical protein
LGLKIEPCSVIWEKKVSELPDDRPETLMWEDKFAEMRESVQGIGKNVKSKVEKMESVTREHPKTALGMAFLTGVAMGGLVIAAFSLSMRRTPERE